jgi:hypothetical protein
MVAPRRTQVIVCLFAAAAAVAAVVVGACSSPGHPRSVVATTVTSPTSSTVGPGAGAPGGVSTTAATTAPGTRPAALAAVTSGGQVTTLDPLTGKPLLALATGATGDEVSLSPDGTRVYYEGAVGCDHQVESVATTGGVPTVVSAGSYPTVSPDGTLLAFARQPIVNTGTTCSGDAYAAKNFSLVIRVLATGAETVYPLPPAVVATGLPLPIDHLSWAADNRRLAVSLGPAQDNEGWSLFIFDRSRDHYYVPASAPPVPVTNPSYYREGVFSPNGMLFVDKVCCSGLPVKVTSDLLLTVDPATGAVGHQIALGLTTVDHSSLDADSTGHWLLYLSGSDLMISQDGARPTKLASGLRAADW